jgi:8-oxo-dGTP diphosphatase
MVDITIKELIVSSTMESTRYAYSYPRPSVATDIVAFTLDDDRVQVLLVERAEVPVGYALPGGFLQVGATPDLLEKHSVVDDLHIRSVDESLEACARRELREETSVEVDRLHFVGAYGNINRDTRGRYVSIAYWTVVRKSDVRLKAATDARLAFWCDFDAIPELQFDHRDIINGAHCLVSQHRNYADFLTLVPDEFTLAQWRAVCARMTGRNEIDASNFHVATEAYRKALVATGRRAVRGPGERGAPPVLYVRP